MILLKLTVIRTVRQAYGITNGGDHMFMSWFWLVILLFSVASGMLSDHTADLSAAVTEGAQKGVSLAIDMAGSMCLWSGVGTLMDRAGLTARLARLLRPLLHRIFPGTRKDPALERDLSANICANLLGLGNAATPMGIRAAKRMVDPHRPGIATDQLCRLIVLNTASIQLIPTTVAAVRSGLGCVAPFDILPAVWITSLCSAGLGVIAAWGLGKVCRP